MENIVLLMLFTYPGAIAYFVYCRMAHGKIFYKEVDTFFKSAICFFLSVLVTVASITILALGNSGLSLAKLSVAIKNSDTLGKYTFISFAISLICGVIYYFLAWLFFQLSNHDRKAHNVSQVDEHLYVWNDIMDNYDISGCCVVVRKNGKMLHAGFPLVLPGDYSKDKSLALEYCDLVEKEINDNGDSIGEAYISYMDLDSDIEIEFRDAHVLQELINKKDKGA